MNIDDIVKKIQKVIDDNSINKIRGHKLGDIIFSTKNQRVVTFYYNEVILLSTNTCMEISLERNHDGNLKKVLMDWFSNMNMNGHDGMGDFDSNDVYRRLRVNNDTISLILYVDNFKRLYRKKILNDII